MKYLYCIWLLLQIGYFSVFANQNQEKRYIEPLPAKNSISGRLFDKATGKSLRFVEVKLTNTNYINLYLAAIERNLLKSQSAGVSIESLSQLAEETRIINDFAKKLNETSFVTEIDENGYFTVALPDEVPSRFPLKLNIRFVNNKVINSMGEPDKCMVNSIENIEIEYKGGIFYEEIELNVTRTNECNGRLIELLGNTHFDD